MGDSELKSAIKLRDQKVHEKRNAPKTYESKPGIKPSDLGSPCYRKNYYVYHRLKSNFPFEMDNGKAADAGDAFHSMIRKWWNDAGLLVENLDKYTGKIPISFIDKKTPDPEFPMYAPDLGIRYAKADGFIKIPDGPRKGLWVLEIKSKKPKQFKYVKSPDKDRYQGHLYIWLLEEAMAAGKFDHIPALKGEREIRGVCFDYIERSAEMSEKEFFEEKDPAIFEEIVKKCVEIIGYVERKELPPKTEDFCPWCPYRDYCAREYKVED